jgi:hypothetical protein
MSFDTISSLHTFISSKDLGLSQQLLASPLLQHRVHGRTSLHFVRDTLHCTQAEETLTLFKLIRSPTSTGLGEPGEALLEGLDGSWRGSTS